MIGRIFVGIWRGLDGLRKFLHLVVLLTIFGFVVGALRTSIPHIADASALVIAPKGEIVEQLSGSPVDQALARVQGDAPGRDPALGSRRRAQGREEGRAHRRGRHRSQLHVGRRAADARGIHRGHQGFPQLGQEGGGARHSFLQESYYVAAGGRRNLSRSARASWPSTAYERYRTYYKDLFDKLGVEVNLFRVGAYKSAAEVYVRTDMSPEDREESLAYLNALWLSYRTAVAEARGLTPTDISDYVANSVPAMLAAKGDAAKVALDAKLVTGPQVIARCRAPHGRARRRGFAQRNRREGGSGRERCGRVVQLHLARGLPARGAGREARARRSARTRSASSSPPAKSSMARNRRERWAAKPPPCSFARRARTTTSRPSCCA